MSDVIGRGVIEVSADSSKLNAAIGEARTRLKALGDAGKDSAAKASSSIDRYIKGLQTQNATLGKSKREVELYKLALKGASDAQLRAANAALKTSEAFAAGQARMAKFSALAKGAGAALVGLAGIAGGFSISAVLGLAKAAGDFQDLSEKTGTSAEALASLAVSAAVGGVSMDEVGDSIVKLNHNLSGVDDESKDAGKALAALGLNIQAIKKLNGADQLEAIGKALNGFNDSAAKSNVIRALLGKSGANDLSFLKELGNEGGRQNILTAKQIQLADDFADRQAKSRAQISLHAQAIATKLLPALDSLEKALAKLAKSEAVTGGLSTAFKGLVYAGIVGFSALASTAAEAAYRTRALGRELVGVKERAVAIGKLDFKKAFSIGQDIANANADDLAELRQFQAELKGIPRPKVFGNDEAAQREQRRRERAERAAKREGAGGGGSGLDDLNFTPVDTEKQKARLDSDISDIQRRSEKVLTTYQNAERIMQARRAAALVEDADYYESKAAFIRLGGEEEKRELNAEIARYGREKFAGKDKIENDRKIADTRGKLAKAEQDTAAQLAVNDIEREASLKKIAQAYDEAAISARAYIDSIKQQSDREIAGIGRGQKFRQRQEGVGAIDDRLAARKGELDSQLREKAVTPEQYAGYLKVAKDTYAEEVRLFDERTNAIEAKQRDGVNGMTEALHNYSDAAHDIAGQTEQAFSNALSGVEDAFTRLASGGKASFKDLLQSIQADFARIGFRTLIGKGTEALLGSIGGGAAGGAGGAAGAISGAGAATAQAAQTAALSASTSALVAESATIAATTVELGALSVAATTAATALASVSASSTASSAGSAAGGIASLFSSEGGRAVGGPVSAGGLYRVNEKGPELLSIAGNQYLMTGQHGGSVKPGGSSSGQQPISVNINQTFAPGTDRTTVSQAAVRSGMEARRALTRTS
jgi:lambda family phage tail tape measure protein